MYQQLNERFYQATKNKYVKRLRYEYKGNDKQTFSHYEKLLTYNLCEATARNNAAIVSCMQGKLAEVYFGFRKTEELIHIYKKIHEKSEERFQSVHAEAVNKFANKFATKEK